MINLKQRLIVDYSSLKSVAHILSSAQGQLILVFFTMAILFEFFGEWNFFNSMGKLVYVRYSA